jgi:hypothetical protein
MAKKGLEILCIVCEMNEKRNERMNERKVV